MKRKYLMKLGMMLICGSLAAGVPVFAENSEKNNF